MGFDAGWSKKRRYNGVRNGMTGTPPMHQLKDGYYAFADKKVGATRILHCKWNLVLFNVVQFFLLVVALRIGAAI